jgi:hypothetical protein
VWRDRGRQAEAHDLLAPVYGWFTEGFDTADLQPCWSACRSCWSCLACAEAGGSPPPVQPEQPRLVGGAERLAQPNQRPS